MSLRSRTALAASILGAALAAWIVAVDRMRGMDAGPGTDLGELGWYIGIWVTMMAAMMLPSAAPTMMLLSRVRRDAPPWLFVLGYVSAWTAWGLCAYVLYRAVRAADPAFLSWDEQGPLVAGSALVLAGLYQLTSLKRACLRRCRSPMRFLIRGANGPLGAVQMGIGNGVYCVGCCTGLMIALFALGVMSLFWMAIIALAIFVEKVVPQGERFANVFAALLVVLGIVVIVGPSSVPGLTQPSDAHTGMGRMTMEMGQ
jgi:predicted metal-binding membrane protein